MFDPTSLLPAGMFAVTELDDERLLYDADSGVLYLLNATAGVIWSLCDGRHGIAEMSAQLRRRFAVPPTCNLERHVHDAIAELVERKLLVASPG
jgi:hypothetical protein